MKKVQQYTIYDMGNRIRARREELGMSRPNMSNLMRKLGSTVDQKTIESWELGRNNCSLTNIPYICEILDCDTEYLFGNSSTPHKEIADVSAITGLSPEAIENLKQIKKRRKYLLPLISEIIENETGKARTKNQKGIDLIERLLLYYMERKNEAYRVQFRAGVSMIGKTTIGNVIAEHFLNDISRTIEKYNPQCVTPDIKSYNLDIISLPEDENRNATQLEINSFFPDDYGTVK